MVNFHLALFCERASSLQTIDGFITLTFIKLVLRIPIAGESITYPVLMIHAVRGATLPSRFSWKD
jgi:hypothetical protein